ncbi:hypothetical protein BS50DRAFT_650624, partial [Corynespora cassiicola Philippines]
QPNPTQFHFSNNTHANLRPLLRPKRSPSNASLVKDTSKSNPTMLNPYAYTHPPSSYTHGPTSSYARLAATSSSYTHPAAASSSYAHPPSATATSSPPPTRPTLPIPEFQHLNIPTPTPSQLFRQLQDRRLSCRHECADCDACTYTWSAGLREEEEEGWSLAAGTGPESRGARDATEEEEKEEKERGGKGRHTRRPIHAYPPSSSSSSSSSSSTTSAYADDEHSPTSTPPPPPPRFPHRFSHLPSFSSSPSPSPLPPVRHFLQNPHPYAQPPHIPTPAPCTPAPAWASSLGAQLEATGAFAYQSATPVEVVRGRAGVIGRALGGGGEARVEGYDEGVDDLLVGARLGLREGSVGVRVGGSLESLGGSEGEGGSVDADSNADLYTLSSRSRESRMRVSVERGLEEGRGGRRDGDGDRGGYGDRKADEVQGRDEGRRKEKKKNVWRRFQARMRRFICWSTWEDL